MAADDPRAARRRAWRSGEAGREQGVPPLSSVVRDAALALRPGRVVDWDGAESLTLEPPAGGGEAWTTRPRAVRWDHMSNGATAWATGVVESLDRAPLELAVLAAALRVTHRVVKEELSGGGRPHDIMTATDVVRGRHRHGTALPGVVRFDDAARARGSHLLKDLELSRTPLRPAGGMHDARAVSAQRLEPGPALGRLGLYVR